MVANEKFQGVTEADPIAVLEAEKADLKDKMLRLMADMENLRRRTEREIAAGRNALPQLDCDRGRIDGPRAGFR